MQDVKEQHLANTLSAMGGTGNSSLYLAEATKVQDFNEAKAERGTYIPVMLLFLAVAIGCGASSSLPVSSLSSCSRSCPEAHVD